MKRLFFIACLIHAQVARAEWRTEEYEVKAGWNAIYSFVDASHITIDELFLGAPDVEEIWRWQPEGNDARLLNTEGPEPTGQEWRVWIRGDSEGSSFNHFYSNYGYLVRMKTGSSPQTLKVVGKPSLPEVRWRTDRAHLVGFPVNETGVGPRFSSYLRSSGLPIPQAEIFRYVGGPIASGTNPGAINPLVNTINRNQAYWVNLSRFSRYYGPLRIDAESGSTLDFGSESQTSSLLLTNLSEETMTVSFTLESPSATPSGQTALVGAVPLLTRLGGETSDTPFTSGRNISLEAGEKKRLVVILDRQTLPGSVGERSGSLLKISQGGVQDMFLPVSAVKTSMAGLWVGEIEVDQVGSIEKRYRRDAGGNTILDPNTGEPELVEDLTTPLSADTLPSVKRPFPLKVIMHVDASGKATLLSHVYSGILSGLPEDDPVGLTMDESLLDPDELRNAVRLAVAHLPLDTKLLLSSGGTFGPSQSLTGTLTIEHDDPTNPFVHQYHPDHDNLDARFENPLPAGQESFTIVRGFTFNFDTSSPAASSATLPGWGSTLLTGTYREDVDGVFKSTLRSQGVFALKKVSSIESLSVAP